ncbi:MAG: CoA transferase [Myxococcota bacterium]
MPARDPLPFAGLRVLELSSEITGPYAGKLFVDAGAEVVKIEAPGGDPMRRWSASFQPIAEKESSPLFQYLNSGKRSLVLDPRDAQDRARFAALAARADIVIEDWGPNGLEDRGLDPEDWLEANPRLAVVRVSPWGQTGPWAGHPANDFTLQAATGSTEYRGLPEREPVAAGGRLGDWIAGGFVAVAAIAAWRSARQTGEGQIVDVSRFEAMIQCLTVFGDMGSQFMEGLLPRSIEIPSIEPTKDGHVGVCTQTGVQWTDFCKLIGRPDIAEDPRFLEGRERMEQIDFMQKEVIHGWTSSTRPQKIIELCELPRIPVAPIGNGRDLPSSTT